jgi:hypothetical protein
MHVFISYAKVDTRDLALRIRDRLNQQPGVTAWMDESLELASSWAAQIEYEIERADYVVVLLSPDVNRTATSTRGRSFVLNEIDYAQQLYKTIIPVIAQPTRTPLQLAGIQYTDLSRDTEVGIDRLISYIVRGAELPEEPPAPPVDALPVSAPPVSVPLRQSNVRLVIGIVAVMLIMIGGGVVLIISQDDRSNPLSEPPNSETQIMQWSLEGTRLAHVPTPNATQQRATVIAIAEAIASETVVTSADTSTPTQNVEATRSIQETQTQASELAMYQALTQSEQLTANMPTNTLRPIDTPTPTLTSTFTGTPPAILQATQTAEANVLSTEVFGAAIATLTEEANEQERVRRAAFNITSAFEGSSYAAYNNYDAGIVSYGRFDFTLTGGGLYQIVEGYTRRSDSPIARQLATNYLDRIREGDSALRNDEQLRVLLVEAARDPIMQAVQDEIATERYWSVVWETYIAPRGIKTPLGQALMFDMAIVFGTGHGFVRLAEEQLGVPPRSQLGENGITEEQLITRVAELRKQSHDRQAERDNLPGLRARGDFWMNLIELNDWQLHGDANGMVEIPPGRRVPVRNP